MHQSLLAIDTFAIDVDGSDLDHQSRDYCDKAVDSLPLRQDPNYCIGADVVVAGEVEVVDCDEAEYWAVHGEV